MKLVAVNQVAFGSPCVWRGLVADGSPRPREFEAHHRYGRLTITFAGSELPADPGLLSVTSDDGASWDEVKEAVKAAIETAL